MTSASATPDVEKQQLVENTPLVVQEPASGVSKWTRYVAVTVILAVAAVVLLSHSPKPTPAAQVPVVEDAAPVVEAEPVNLAASCGFRVRKNWDRYTPAEKARYLKAVQMAMSKGLYERFVQIHGETANNKEAHGSSCVFLLWHRKYLIGFENMLRSLSPEFACLTIPYYDYIQHAVNRLSSKCVTMEECSPILREMGGSRGTPSKAVVAGRTYTNCVAKYPLSSSCEDPTKSCNKCVPRGSWSTTNFPNIGYALIKKGLLYSNDYLEASKSIEMNPHNMVHNALKGVMMDAYMSPTEPVFFSHHATIDLLHAIYQKCKVTPLGLKGEDLYKHPKNFVGCTQPPKDPNGRVITYQTEVLMLSIYKGVPTPVDEDPELKQYFVGLPPNYAQFTDTKNLGDNSYVYEIPGLLGDLWTRCEGSDSSFDSLAKIMLNKLNLNRAKDEETVEAVTPPVLKNKVIPITRERNIAYLAWRHEIALLGREQNLTARQIDADLAKMIVYIYDKYLPGEVKDYSPEFKEMWRITEPSLSKQILDGINDGTHPIRIDGWRAVTEKYFGASICGTCNNCRYVNPTGSINACHAGWTAEQCDSAGDGYTWCGDVKVTLNATCGTCKNCYHPGSEACYDHWKPADCASLPNHNWCGN
ncbi:hypothetical protein LEN26_020870 [Aphanomyces euteiches]|nr:hypothetical protein LEN26_020870 [Aphanomyces euteiches]KAH9103479.1 hypothetical protein AeMF1_020177 [Aphanomyces euteiches]